LHVAKKKDNKEKAESISWFARLRKKSRISIYDIDSFEMKRYFLLSPWNIFIGTLFFIILIVTGTWFTIAYSPLRQSIPGYPKIAETEKLKRQQIENIKLLEELQKKEQITYQYNKTLLDILNEDLPDEFSTADSLMPLDSSVLNNINFDISEQDSLLRKKVAEKEKYGFSLTSKQKNSISDNISGVYFFTPLHGEVIEIFDPKKGVFGIQINAPNDEAVKSTLDGTVIHTDWSSSNGHVIHVQHAHNLVSVYKHNSYLLKNQGDIVKSGEPIAIVGSNNANSKNIGLVFELWYNGIALDPKQFVNF
jgi:murein DD-endopeptidase MepM/ murein hydrolase activator NlpD